MTTIALACVQRGVEDSVRPDAMVASVDVNDYDAHLAGVVSWICSHCRRFITAELAWRPFLTLVLSGVPLLDTGPFREELAPPHPEHPQDGQRLTADDVLELHELLETDAWFGLLDCPPDAPP